MYYKSKMINTDELVKILEEQCLLISAHLNKQIYQVNGIQTDSRKIKKGDLFVCISGFETDGHNYAEKAIENGTIILICERKISDFPHLIVNNSRKAAAVISKFFYNNPTGKLKLTGITGTNGKTTTSHILASLLRSNKRKTGIIGTLGYYIEDKHFPLSNTTPDIIELNENFIHMLAEKVEYVVLEVSSHALALDRVYGLEFDLAIFTNISQDHLDFHKNIEDYAKEKFKLFHYTNLNKGISIINIDDEFGRRFYNSLQNKKISYSISNGDYLIKNTSFNSKYSQFSVEHDQHIYDFKLNLIGKHNVYNFVSAFAAYHYILPADVNDFSEIDFINIPGRLEKVMNEKDLAIYVDYAHTPDALENVLKTLKEINNGRLYCVFGAGGDRDKKKRPEMLSASLKYADLSIVTTDNPRTEDPSEIIRNIVSKAKPFDPFWIISDRKKAIEVAISLLNKDDILLIAGKGHENYQIIGNEKIPFDDRKVAADTVKKLDYLRKNESELSIPIDILQLEHLFQQKLSFRNSLFYNISTDSRQSRKNSIFFALQGENFDGHNYVSDFLQNSNCIAVVNKKYKSSLSNIIYVDDTLIALGQLAKKYKSLFPTFSIAITGSSGKTTTKEFMYNILSSVALTLKTHKNENNQIGLPKTIFKLSPKYKYAIYELGSNHFGEIAYLSDICEPDAVIVTNIGASHLQYFNDLDGVYKEKSSLLRRQAKIKIFPGDDHRFQEFSGITFGFSDRCDYQISNIQVRNSTTTFKIAEQNYEIASPFAIYALNATIAISLAKELNIEEKIIHSSLKMPPELNLRMQFIESGQRIFLADCYNANPDSMSAALDFWKDYKPELPHIAILGDMLELGELKEKYHQQISEKLIFSNCEKVISVGDLSKLYQADTNFTSVEDFIKSNLLDSFPLNAVILLKASHGIHLEKILKRI